MKTLGVKFQVAGVKEAQAGLDNLRKNLNASLKQNKQAVRESNNLSAKLKKLFRGNQTVSDASTENETAANNIVRLDRYSIDEIGKVLQRSGTEKQKKGLVGGLFSRVNYSFASIYKGFLESVGAGLGADFGEGLKKGLAEDLDLSFSRRGEVAGKTISYGVAEGGRGLWDGFQNFMDSLRNAKAKVQTPEQAKDDVDGVGRALIKLITVLPDKIITGYRRSSVELEGLPRVDKQIKRPENKGTKYKNTTEQVVYTISGFGGMEGQGGLQIAELLKEHADDATEIVGLTNKFTDLGTNYKKTTQWVIEALGTLGTINVQGFNPDSIAGSAKVINDLEANPKLKARILGYSAGGFVSEEMTQILNLLGYGDRIQGISAGTPNMKGRLDADNFQRVMGDNDTKMRNLEKAMDKAGFLEDDSRILENVPDHFFNDYLQSEEFLEVALGNRISTIIKSYQRYLENLVKQSKKLANNRIEALLPGYKRFTLDQKKSSAADLSNYLKTISKRYRQAVKENDLNLAKELGENLLRQIQLLRQVYGDILDEGGENRSISGKLGNLTTIETEVIKGQPNLGEQGYDTKGLVNHFGEQLTGEAGFVVDGFVEGIKEQLDRVKQAGDDIGDAVQDGTDENLGIASPAKRYIRKGKQVVQGFINGIRTRFSEVRNAGQELGDRVSEGTEQSANGFKSWFSQIGDRFPLLKKFKGLLGGIATLFLGGLGIRFAINLINQLGKEALATALALESVDRAIVFISRNPIEGLQNINFITDEAKKLSVGLNEAKEAYSGLLGAAKNTPLEGVQTERLFSAFAESAARRGIDAQGQNRLFTALEQIISKRKLGAEEVTQQIGDIRGFGDFKGLIQQAMGVSSAELDKMMRQGEVGLDVLPKVVALIEAQNASADGTQTAQQALTKYNNSLLEFKGTLGGVLQPLEKLKLNILSSGLDFLTEKLDLIFTLIGVTGGVALLALYGQVNLHTLANIAWGKSYNFVTVSLQKLWASKLTLIAGLGKLVAAYGLVAVAYLAVSNAFSLRKNQYQDLADGADKMAAGIDRYRDALEAATNSQNKFNTSQQSLELKEGLPLPQWAQNIAGQEKLNFDIVRRGLDWVYDRPGGKLLQYGPAALLMRDRFGRGSFATEAERRDNDRRVATGDVSSRTNQILFDSPKAFAAAERINEYDRQIREIQAKRLELLPGDKEALEASLEAEREISKERDKELKFLTIYQQELQNAIAQAKERLALPNLSDNERAIAQDQLYDAQKTLSGVNNRISQVTKSLNEFQRQLRNSSERINNFIERRGLEAQAERTAIISEGIELGKGDRTIQLELEASSRRELQDYISELEKTIAEGTKRLQSGALAEGLNLIQQSAGQNALTLETDTINRMLQDDRDQGQKDALNELLKIRENETKLSQYQEQLAQNLQQNRNAVLDFNRTINDYFFRLTQQIKEAQLETERLLSQIFYTDIKNRLRSAIAPGSNTFVNGIIDNIQSVIDQASQVAQKVFGDSAAQLGFESESRTMATEMQDFIRQIGSAGDALQRFTQRVNGNNPEPAPPSVPPIRGDAEGRGVYFPIAGLTANTAKITSKHGWRTIFGRRDFHEGIDIAAKGGTQVRATNAGIVRHIKPLADQTQVGIETAKGVMEWFIHLGQNLQVKKGDRVAAGQVIGSVAHTSQRARQAQVSTGDHLDYRVQVNGKWVNPMEYLKSNAQFVDRSEPSNGIGDRAIAKVQQLLGVKQQNLKISELTTEQEREALAIQVKQTIEANKRAIAQGNRENARNLLNVQNRFAEFGVQYDFQSADNQAQSALRQITQQFLDANQEVNNQVRNTEDAIATIQNSLPVLDREIARLKAIGTPEALAVAQTKEAAKTGLQDSLSQLEANLTKIKAIQEDSAELEAKYTQFVITQNELKKEQENFNKQNLKLNQQAFIAEQRGTIEQQRRVKIAQEELRLSLRLNELRQQYAPGEYLDSLIKGEQRQSIINLENIDFQSQQQELDLEKQLLDLQSQINDKKGGFLSKIGLNLQGDRLKKESAIAAENIRFREQLLKIQKDFAEQPDKLAEFTAKAQELNRVNLDNINSQFKSLGGTVSDAFISSTQGFFDNVVNNFFDGAGQQNQQALQERLRYAEEVAQLEQQYRDQPGLLFHLKSRARELNQEKLDGIAGEFNIFKRGVDLARQALIEFVKQLAKVAAQQAAGRFISSLLGGVFGGGTPLSSPLLGGAVGGGTAGGFAGGVSAFVADEGATVGSSDIEQRKISDRTTSYLRRTFPGVAQAWKAEGEGAQLGVFHTGEELLSRKTGEAGRYQWLKQRLGINPLAKIGVFADGGTVGFDAEANILSGFGDYNPRFDVSALKGLEGRGQRAEGRREVHLIQNISVPDADSFRLNSDQRNQDLLESLQRGFN